MKAAALLYQWVISDQELLCSNAFDLPTERAIASRRCRDAIAIEIVNSKIKKHINFNQAIPLSSDTFVSHMVQRIRY